MKRSLLKIVLVLTAMMIVLFALPVQADWYSEGPGSHSSVPWWEVCPPKVYTRTRVVTRTVETMIESIDAEGYCYTAIKRVNVRSQPSIHATRVQTIRSAGTEFKVSARVKNSAGEIWYAVLLANGTLGYIRSDLLNTDHVILLGDPYAYEEEEETKAVAASESASAVLNIVKNPDGEADPTPQVIYVTPAPQAETKPTPTPIIVYVTPEPEVTPQVIYVSQD
jgi:uncharacterized protein YgiM (DUF1202 family)